MATLGSIHQMGIPGLEDFRPIGVGKKDKTDKSGKTGKSGESGKSGRTTGNQGPPDSVHLSRESKESSSVGGGVLNLLKGLLD